MQEIIQHLMENPDLIEKIKAGTVQMIGLTVEENEFLKEVFQSNLTLDASIRKAWRN
ncbi:competence pheromone ComX [Metabacillus halosaccharovorans]|uniref:competence pheromone ComX n=1 Tax=Metabacillus halosaccharovorans TaxID=930124 RepID=UPI001C1FAD31|nr:competence pheromone ComX [Metabacillus halosaccharovorans]MBU7594725.1 competence pheromone ComX [Metabacillus halosaccharovorans]